MNVYEKLIEARLELCKQDIKKGGMNPFAKFPYYTLEDFIPSILELEKKHKFISIFTHDKENSTLTIINIEKPDEIIVFGTETKTAKLPNAHAVQNLGAEHTFMKRYLYMNAFEITEGDSLDATIGKKENVKETSNNYKNDAEAIAIETAKGLAKIMGKLNNDDNKEFRAVVISTICTEQKVDKWADIKFNGNFTYKFLVTRVAAILKNEKELAAAGV